MCACAGVPKCLSALLSGEAKDTADLGIMGDILDRASPHTHTNTNTNTHTHTHTPACLHACMHSLSHTHTW